MIIETKKSAAPAPAATYLGDFCNLEWVGYAFVRHGNTWTPIQTKNTALFLPATLKGSSVYIVARVQWPEKGPPENWPGGCRIFLESE